jgi:hypothetical protein
MTYQEDFTRPPRIAAWLVKLFASVEEESVLAQKIICSVSSGSLVPQELSVLRLAGAQFRG